MSILKYTAEHQARLTVSWRYLPSVVRLVRPKISSRLHRAVIACVITLVSTLFIYSDAEASWNELDCSSALELDESGATLTATPLAPSVINKYPHPTNAFTQGLIYEDGYVIESTGLYGQSRISRRYFDKQTEEQYVAMPDRFFAEGITAWQDGYIALTWKAGLAFRYDKQLKKTGFYRYQGQGWGITHNDEHLITSDGSEYLTYREPRTFDVVKRVKVSLNGESLTQLNELEYIAGCVFANVWGQPFVAVIIPSTGQVKAVIDLRALLHFEHFTLSKRLKHNPEVLNGIAYREDQQTLLVTGKRWAYIYELSLNPEPSVTD